MKHMIVSMLLVLALLMSSLGAFAEGDDPVVTVLPEITSENEETIFAERNALNVNDETVTPMHWQGFLELNVKVGDVNRTAKIYIPKNLPVGSLAVTMNAPEGVTDTIAFLQESGWVDIADENRIWLIVSEPVDGKWGTIEEERDYLTAVFKEHRAQNYFRGNLSMYVVGYGEMGTVLQELVMEDPLYTAAAVFMDCSEIDTATVESYLSKSMDTETRTYNVDYKDVPVPVWVSNATVTDENQAVAEYWKTVSHVGQTAVTDETYGEVFTQAEDSFFTPEGPFVQVAVQNAEHDYTAPETTNAIADFLLQYFRTGAGSPWSNMITHKVDYEAMGVKIKSFTDSNGIARQYIVYVPENLREATEPQPVVFMFHGVKESARNAFEQSMWYKIADEKGFIVVVPEASLNGKLIGWKMDETDIDYINELLDRVVAEYPVDESRLYYSGHSMGIMLCNYAFGGDLANRFAAIGGTSSGMNAEPIDGGCTTPVPYFISVGEYDTVGSYKLEEESMITNALDYWLVRNGVATEETVDEIRVNGADETFVEGRNHNYVWKNEDGIPVVRYAWVEGKDHMITLEEDYILWDEWFSHWSIGEGGVRLYDGQPIVK